MRTSLYVLGFAILLASCKKEDPVTPNPPSNNPVIPATYFPNNWVAGWETYDADSLGWDTDEIDNLYQFLDDSDTRAFIVLFAGRIVLEHYNGQGINGQPFTRGSLWYWASAGKTLTATAVGIAEGEGLLQIEEPASNYLNVGWTSATPAQEAQINIENMLSMTSGLDDGVSDSHCFDPSCLQYLADAGTRWAYHNGPYTKLHDLITVATGSTFDEYVKTKIGDNIGMSGAWFWVDSDHVFFSNARGMARFGLLNYNNGIWKDSTLIPSSFFENATTPSQTINPAYGYLYWLNGEDTYKLPNIQTSFSGAICPNAPDDMYAAIGKNSQLINIAPSQGLVVIRMGESPDNSLVSLNFMNEMWAKLNAVTGY